MTPQQDKILAILVDAYPAVVPRSAFASILRVKRRPPYWSSSLDVQICNIRREMREQGSSACIKTEIGEGLRFSMFGGFDE